jgi:ABC-type dipeptide/oligopeptide/nickel transport system permease subunit
MVNKWHIRWQTVLAVILVLVVLIIAVLAEKMAPTTGILQDGVQLAGRTTDFLPHPPSPEAILGTTSGQLDIFYSLVHGMRDALIFGLTTTLLTALIGIIVGGISGMRGGWINQLGMRLSDGILCFPVIAGIAFFQQLIDLTKITQTGDIQMFLSAPFSVTNTQAVESTSLITRLNPVMIALILLCWVPYARTLNVLILQTVKLEFVTAAKAAGATTWRIFFKHILPNTSAPLIVLATKDIGQMVVLQTTFSFVGFTGMSAWATPLIVSRSWIIGLGGDPWIYWWVYLPVTLAIILFAFSWNFLGDELNYWLNPRKN